MLNGVEDLSKDYLSKLLQVSDSAYPTGSFSHSYGLEGMLQIGVIKNESDLQLFIEQEIDHSLKHLELPILHHAYLSLDKGDFAELSYWDKLSGAAKQPTEFRLASTRVGKQRFRLLRDVIGAESIDSITWEKIDSALPSKHLAVVSAIESWTLEIPLKVAMISYSVQNYASILTAALKLMRLGQTAIQRILHQHSKNASYLVDEAMTILPEKIGSFTPLLDIAACQHQRAFSRMFLS
ncbi:MAG: urease accessory UreF family protein [Verrucomicrobiota bacterium]